MDLDTSITQQHGAGLFTYKAGYLKGVFHVGTYIYIYRDVHGT